MDHLHYAFDAEADDIVEVTLDHPANVQLMDSANYENYKHRLPYRYHGGYVTRSPYQIVAPHNGHWHVVVDLGGEAGSVRAAVRLISSSARAAS